jgi:CBS domain-containing protein
MAPKSENQEVGAPISISDDDIYAAMKDVSGYLDITPADLKQVYLAAYRHAVARLTGSLKAKDIMTRDVAAVPRDTPLPEVAAVMARRGISGVPVVDPDGRVVGVISGKDFLAHMGAEEITNFMAVVATCLKEKGCKATGIRGKNAADLMTSPAVTIGEDTPIIELTKILKEKAINRLPVTDSQGRLVGLVCRADILRSMYVNI